MVRAGGGHGEEGKRKVAVKSVLAFGHWALFFSLLVYFLFFVKSVVVGVSEKDFGSESVKVFLFVPRNSSPQYWGRGFNAIDNWQVLASGQGIVFQGNYSCAFAKNVGTLMAAYGEGSGPLSAMAEYTRWKCCPGVNCSFSTGIPPVNCGHLTEDGFTGPAMAYSFQLVGDKFNPVCESFEDCSNLYVPAVPPEWVQSGYVLGCPSRYSTAKIRGRRRCQCLLSFTT